MGALHYLFGFNGRINRAKVWLFLLIVIGFEIVVALIAMFGFDWTDFVKSIQAQMHAAKPPVHLDWCALIWPKANGMRATIVLSAIIAIVVLYVWAALAIYVKRLHDRNKSGWWLVLYWLMPMALNGYAFYMAHSIRLIHLTPAGKVAYCLALLIGLWVFIELWCLRGTKGPNRFGNDPLDDGPVHCDPEKPVEGCIPKA